VYVGGRGATAATMTPYDVAAVRLSDGLELAGSAPDDADQYRRALRSDPSARVAALVASGDLVTAGDVADLLQRVARLPWTEAEARARAAGALVGAYPTE